MKATPVKFDKYYRFCGDWLVRHIGARAVNKRIFKKITDYRNDVVRNALTAGTLKCLRIGTPSPFAPSPNRLISIIKKRRPNWRKLGLGNLMS